MQKHVLGAVDVAVPASVTRGAGAVRVRVRALLSCHALFAAPNSLVELGLHRLEGCSLCRPPLFVLLIWVSASVPLLHRAVARGTEFAGSVLGHVEHVEVRARLPGKVAQVVAELANGRGIPFGRTTSFCAINIGDFYILQSVFCYSAHFQWNLVEAAEHFFLSYYKNSDRKTDIFVRKPVFCVVPPVGIFAYFRL
jgi:hypothetical protein